VVRSCLWTIGNKGKAYVWIQKRISVSACPERIHRSRYEHFLLGSAGAAWTLGPYILAYFAVFLVPHMHYSTFIAAISYFNNKGIRYLRNDNVSEIWVDRN
jgi:hypothetical protein